MKRLTKTYSNGFFGVADDLPCGENSYDFKNLLIKTLGEYEDAEENGLLFKLPCKVGDTVYVDSSTFPTGDMYFDEQKGIPTYFVARVVSFRRNSNGWFIKLSVRCKRWREWLDDETGHNGGYCETEKYHIYPLSAIGKTIFLTREEAEAALDRMENKR